MSTLTPRINKLDRNEIINGNFDFWQRNITGTFTNGTTGYVADRFKVFNQGTTSKSITVARSVNVPTLVQSGYQSLYSAQFTSNTVVSSLATTDYILPFSYTIEGYDLQRFVGKSFTISFWTYASVAGTYCLSMNNANGTRSYVTTYTVSSPNTWEQKFINITMDTVGPFNFDNTAGLNIYFGALTGTTYQTSSFNTWQSINVFGAVGATNYMATSGATFNIAQVMINETTSSSNQTFHRRGLTIGDELVLCRRYFEKTWAPDIPVGTSGDTKFYTGITNAGGAGATNEIKFSVEKRITPTISYWNGGVQNSAFFRRASTDSTTSLDVTSLTNSTSFHALNNTLIGAFVIFQVGFSWSADADF